MSYQSATLGIMTSDTFKNRTQATRAVAGITARFKSRGNNMDAIDNALARWERDCNKPTVTSFDKTAILMIIERECNDWLARKRGKSSALAQYRSGTITQLAIDAKKAASYMRNKYYTEQKAQSHAHTRGGGRVQTKSLDGAYKLERQDYLGRGKAENPRAAGAMEGAGLNLGTMTLGEYGSADVAQVYYHDRKERMEYMTYIEGGRFFDGGGLADCPVKDGFNDSKMSYSRMYAVDKYGNLFTKEIKGFDGTYFNHSSFCAGKEVICAGTILFSQGRLKFISTNSGHYKPAPPQLKLYLASLAAEDVYLEDVCVFVKDSGGVPSFLRVSTFLDNMRAATDWPMLDAAGKPQVMVGGSQVSVAEPA